MFKILKPYPNLFIAFSQKKDGSMKLTENPKLRDKISKNRKRYFEKVGIPPSKVVSAEIVHKCNVENISEKDSDKVVADADGLITQNKNIYLSITSADCLPVFLFDPKKEAAGVLHAGWRSLEKEIIRNAIDKFQEYFASDPSDILAAIGPAICQKHYEIGLEVAKFFRNYPEAIRQKNQKIYIDIKKIAKLQLIESGIEKENIEISPECTFELPEKYFSARRDKKKEVEAMIAVIGMRVKK